MMSDSTRPSETYAEEFTWQPYRISPRPVWAMRMNEDFECTTLQGTLYGKAGDWLVRQEDGWTYPIKDEIFKRCYVKREWRKPNESKEGNTQVNETAKVVDATHGPRQL